MWREPSGAIRAWGVVAFTIAIAAAVGPLRAQNYVQPLEDVAINFSGNSAAASYQGPHSGNAPVLTLGGVATALDDRRGVVNDGGGDAFDGFGYLSVNNTASRTIERRATRIYTGPNGHSAFRWADTITNTTNLPQTFSVRFGGDLGSDSGTTVLASGPGFRVSADSALPPFGDPVVAIVWGVNGVVGTPTATPFPAGQSPIDGFVITYNLILQPGASTTLVHLALLGSPNALGGTYASNTATACLAQGFVAAISGQPSPDFPEPLNPGCDLQGPIANWYTPHSALALAADVWNGVTRSSSYLGTHTGSAPPLIGMTAASDERGAIGDGGGDAFDTFGLLYVSGSAAERTIQRNVRTFATSCDSGWRWVDTVTNTSGSTQSFNLAFGGDLGSDASTIVKANGVVYRLSTQNAAADFGDPPLTLVWGNNQRAVDASDYSLDGQDDLAVLHSFELAPGQSATFVHFALIGDRGPGGDDFTQQRAMQLVARGRNDRLFAGVTATNILNWREEPSCPGDANRDGAIDLLDLLDFIAAWSANLGQNCP